MKGAPGIHFTYNKKFIIKMLILVLFQCHKFISFWYEGHNQTSLSHSFHVVAQILNMKVWSTLNSNPLTHWGRVTHICVSNLTTIGSDNDLSPERCQAIIQTNAGILSIAPLGINFSEISMEIQTFSFRKMHLKSSSAKWRPSCLGPQCVNSLSWGMW